MKYWVSFMLHLLVANCNAQSTSEYFFPIDSFLQKGIRDRSIIEVDSFMAEAFASELECMNEPSIYLDSLNSEVYRFTFLRAWEDEFSIRIVKSTDSIALHLKVLNFRCNQNFSDNILLDYSTRLQETDWLKFKTELDKSDFWNLSSQPHNGILALDQDFWLFEGLNAGRYDIFHSGCVGSAQFHSVMNVIQDLVKIDNLILQAKLENWIKNLEIQVED